MVYPVKSQVTQLKLWWVTTSETQFVVQVV